VVQNAWGKPEVIYSARGERLRRRLGVGEGHVTLTDEAGLIVAVAVLLRRAGKVPAGKGRPGKVAAGKVRAVKARAAARPVSKRGSRR
jgi:hypothetical protein